VDVSNRDLDRAAEILRMGGLVAFPTETVYGLGANALDPIAVRRIYEVKGRPETSPCIVHVSGAEFLPEIAADWNQMAKRLAARFWPGPLTLVVRKTSRIPPEVTAGLETVGIRMPAHPVAMELLRRAGLPVAAPSANRFTKLSPTTAEHVRSGLGGLVDFILDGGPATVGLESTVLSLVDEKPVLLRPGMVSVSEIEQIVGPLGTPHRPPSSGPHASPGLHARHYAPATPLYLLQPGEPPPDGLGRVLHLPRNPAQFAATLYAELHAADAEGWDWIAITMPPSEPGWDAVRDRLVKASTSRTPQRAGNVKVST